MTIVAADLAVTVKGPSQSSQTKYWCFEGRYILRNTPFSDCIERIERDFVAWNITEAQFRHLMERNGVKGELLDDRVAALIQDKISIYGVS